MVIKHLLI
ncbi:hypothetical protein YPPY14_1623, partial [Yersinia pestis PY-14]